jgi:toxin-antitoxin system PIN domain toxin
VRVFDVNVLVLAHRFDQPGHEAAVAFVETATASERPFSVPPVVGIGVVRVSTHPRIFDEPTPLTEVIDFLNALRGRPLHVPLDETTAWPVFTRVCHRYDARGNRVPDAYLAALAIANGATLVTADRGLARYAELAVEYPPGL